MAEIEEKGYERLTMSAVAARAGSSKESLYTWFGNKTEMIAELIRAQSARTNAAVQTALATERPARQVLGTIADNLLALLLGRTSLALNRAAMTSPALAAELLRHGRHTTGPLVERYLAELHNAGVITIDDPAEAFTLFYGLTVQDLQIRALLGETPPSAQARKRAARTAVERFLALCAPEGAL